MERRAGQYHGQLAVDGDLEPIFGRYLTGRSRHPRDGFGEVWTSIRKICFDPNAV